MEFKKKTIIWEDNNEPPKNYIWVRTDGKAYEYDHDEKYWKLILIEPDSECKNYDLYVDSSTVSGSINAEKITCPIKSNSENLTLKTTSITLSNGCVIALSYNSDTKQLEGVADVNTGTWDYGMPVEETIAITFEGDFEDEITINVPFYIYNN